MVKAKKIIKTSEKNREERNKIDEKKVETKTTNGQQSSQMVYYTTLIKLK